MTATLELTREAIERIDASRQADDVLALPDQLRDALWRVESASLEPHDAPGGLVIAGMGGSAIGGELARAALGLPQHVAALGAEIFRAGIAAHQRHRLA